MHTAVEYQMILETSQVAIAQLYTQTTTKGGEEKENWPSELTGQIRCLFAVSDGRQAYRQTDRQTERLKERKADRQAECG